ncbi:MAG: lysophospholipase [Flavobacteriaceae bacterium]|nr:lysophospholipase [Flavobacteriaceae bacterium]
MKNIITTITIFVFTFGFAQEKNYTEEEITLTNLIEGTLLVPHTETSAPLVIIIQGSGPTDRDGNQPNMRNNSLKYLAESLAEEQIATFRFDKRLVKLARQGRLKEEDINFNDFIEDANAVIKHFQDDNRFSHLVIAGHSEGSLVGMVAATNDADAFISIAGAGQQIDTVIVEQLRRQSPELADEARKNFDELRETVAVKNYSVMLSSIFRESVQPFIYSWMQYNPKTEIAKLDIPVLILNGTEDIQTDVEEARLLHQSKPLAEMYLIEGMNHIFKEITKGDTIENAKSYNEPQRPIMPELVERITVFIKGLDN